MNIFPGRSLTEGELKDITAPQGTPVVARLRHSHHALARMLAQGVRPSEAAAATGYAVSRISTLQQDPAFVELVEFYKHQVEGKFLDMSERLAALGMDAVQELQTRLDETPDKFTVGQLLDIVNTVKPENSPSPVSATPLVQVTFVEHTPRVLTIDGEKG